MTFKGLDDKSSPTAVQDGRAVDLQNVKLHATSALSKRNGYALIYQTLDIPDRDPAAVTGLYYTKLSTGTAYRIAISDKRFYYDASGTWTWVGYHLSSGNNYQFVFETALDEIFLTNDQDLPLVYTPTVDLGPVDFSDLTTAITKAKCVAWFKNYLIWGNTYEGAEKPTRVRWSNVGTTETYTDADYIDIAELGGQEIEAFGILYDNLYIFLTDSIYKLSLVGGDEVFVLSKVVDGIGCIAKNSVQSITLQNSQTGFMFLDDDSKVYFFNGITAQYISFLIEGTMDGLNAERLAYAVSADSGTDYYLCVSDGASTTNNLLLDFEYEIGEWTKHTQIDANAMAKIVDSDSVDRVWFGNYDNYVYELDDTSLDSDIYGTSGTVDAVNGFTRLTVSGTQVLYDSSQTWTESGLIGAIIRIIDGTALGEEKIIIYNTTSGMVVDSAFSTTPDTTSAYSVGDIDAYYTTKWYDLGNAPKRKQFQELFLWAEEQGSGSMDISWAKDFAGTLDTDTVSMAGSGSLWGTAIWGTDTWGGQDALFSRTKLDTTARYFRLKFMEDDIDETFKLYGYSFIFEPRDIW